MDFKFDYNNILTVLATLPGTTSLSKLLRTVDTGRPL